jgi:hypothetical protein
VRLDIDQYEKTVMGSVVRDGQCVALFRDYAEVCYGIPHTGTVVGAINLWTDFDSNPLMAKYFEKVEGDPQKGDAAIFQATATNSFGHVAIVIERHTDGMNVMEQDGFKLNGVKPGFWTFRQFVGALRCKDPSQWEA